jgi:DNA-binding transcriptional LysR family regulator
MNVDALRLFAETARRGSFAAIAKDRDLDPSSVSRVIAGLEADLGLRLFQRTTRRMTLTEAGDIYLRKIEPLLDELDRARDEALNVSRIPSGTLRLSASVTFGQIRLLPLLPAFRKFYPDLKLDLVFTDANVDLVAERIDLAIRLAPAVEGDLIATKLVDTHYRIVASQSYRQSASPLTKPSDLANHKCLLFPFRAFRNNWFFRDGRGRIEEIPIQSDITISNALGLREAAIAGLGPTLLPDWLVGNDIKEGRLIDLFPGHEVTATTFETAAWLIYPSRVYLPNKVRVMIDFLKENLIEVSDRRA